MNKSIKSLLVVLAIGTGFALSGPRFSSAQSHKDTNDKLALATVRQDPKGEEDDAGLMTANVSIEEAVRTALNRVPGYVNMAELEVEDGKTIWSLDIVEPGGKSRKGVEIDANNGSIIKVEDGEDNDGGGSNMN